MSVTVGARVAVDTAQLDALIGGLDARVQRIIEKYAALLLAEAKRLAPVRTGALRDEIHADLTAYAAEIVSDVPYSAEQEYGTSKVPSHPYMRPSLERYAPAFIAELQALIGG